MQKYKVTERQLKTRSCTYYQATDITTGYKVLIKKLGKGRTWQQLLNDKYISLMKLESYSWTPHIIEIIKDQERYYIVFKSHLTPLKDFLNKNNALQVVMSVAKRVGEIVIELMKEKVNVPAVRAEDFFIEKGELKLMHLPEGEIIDFTNASPERVSGVVVDGKSNVFEIGCMIVEGLTGKPLIEAANKKEYQQKLTELYGDKQVEENDRKGSLKGILRGAVKDFGARTMMEEILEPNHQLRPDIETTNLNLQKYSDPSFLSHSNMNKVLLLDSLLKIDNNRITTLRKCNQISTRFLQDDYPQLSQIPPISSVTQPIPHEQNCSDNTALIKPKHFRNDIVFDPVRGRKRREKTMEMETLPKLYSKKEQHTNYAVYRHQHLGVESDLQATEGFGDQKFTNL